jgi:NAD(P) transhydrogenase subunit alpha
MIIGVGTYEVRAADAVVEVTAPTLVEITHLRRGAVIISMMAPAGSPQLVGALTAHGVTAPAQAPARRAGGCALECKPAVE